MQQNRIDLLYKLLTIIHYSKDKKAFIKEFEAMHYAEALMNMLEQLPSNIRELLRLKIQKGDKGEGEILKHFTAEEYKKEVNKVAEEALKDFITVISPVLTLAQKQKIAKLLQQ